MARTNKKISQTLIFLILAIFLIASISLPVVKAEEAATAVVEDEDVIDMDTPVKEEEPVEVVEEVKVEEVQEEVKEVEEEAQEEVVEEVKEEVVEEVKVVEEVVEEEVKVVEEEVVEEEEVQAEPVKEEATPPSEPIEEDEVVEETTTTRAVLEETPSKKLSIPLVGKLTKQNCKKIAAFSLGAWGAVTGVGWAMQQLGGDSD